MALTFTVLGSRGVAGSQRFVDFTVLFDSSYPTNGESIASGDYVTLMGAGRTVNDIDICLFETHTTGKTAALDRTNQKISLWNGTTEMANLSDQSSVTIRGRIYFDRFPS